LSRIASAFLAAIAIVGAGKARVESVRALARW
jgi:hypothetical protein